ncbi:MAG: TonB-dependent receptor, partial [Bacteroidota bacterium]
MRIITVFLLTLFTVSAFGQTGDIRGFVYEQETSEPSIYTSVYLKGTTYGAQTNLDGFFSISRIPPGSYELLVTSIGYDTLKLEVIVNKGDIITKKLYLKKSSIQMKELEVSGEREEMKSDVRIGVNKIVAKEIKQLPSVGGEADLAQYLQVVPGIVSSGDQGGQLYIRGGTPIQNKLLLDGMVVYNPFHSIGLYSVIDPDIMRGADVYTGGYNAEYGDRISSIMDITTRDGNKRRLAGKAGVNTFASKLILEGPLKKEQENAEGSSSFLLSARTSYLDKTSKTLYPYASENGLPFSFTDLYGKVSFNSSTGSKVNFFGFRFSDRASYNGIADLNWDARGIGTNFVVVPAGSSVLVDGNFAISKYGITLQEQDNQSRYSDIGGFNAGFNFTNFKGRHEIKYGIDVAGIKTNYLYQNIIGAKIEQNQNSTQGGGFLKFKFVTDKLVIEPGFRLGYYASLAELSPEPRLGFKYNATDRLRFKLAAGYYAQNLMAGTSDRDVVNLFYSFLTGSDDLPDEFDGREITSRLQKAKHLVV